MGGEALFVSHLPNIVYLTNFSWHVGRCCCSPGRRSTSSPTFATCLQLSALQAGPAACPGLEVCPVGESYEETLVAVLAQRSASPRVGFEAAHLTVSRLRWLEATLRGGPAVELSRRRASSRARACRKDAGEQATLREAARRLSAVLQGVMADIRAGLTEIDVGAGARNRHAAHRVQPSCF